MTTSFAKIISLWIVFAAVGLGVIQGMKAQASGATTTNATSALTNLVVTHGPFLQAPSETSVTISWATSRKCVCWVEYRPEASPNWLTNVPWHHGLLDADVTVHNVTLTGLTPGSRDVYRGVSREIVVLKPWKVVYGPTITSPEYGFTTLDVHKASTAFVVVNDRHEKVRPLAASFAAVVWPNVDLAFLNGDMVEAVKDEPQLYRAIIDPCVEGFATCIPLVYVRGNHDTRGSFAHRLLDYFRTDSGRKLPPLPPIRRPR